MPHIRRSPIWPDPRVKPPFGAAEIDWSHPLARQLHIVQLYRSDLISDVFKNGIERITSRGLSIPALTEIVTYREALAPTTTSPFTWCFSMLGYVNRGDSVTFLSAGDRVSRIYNGATYIARIQTAGFVSIDIDCGADADFRSIITATWGDGTWSGYRNGIPQGSSAVANHLVSANTVNWWDGGYGSGDFDVIYLFTWTRSLSDSEVLWHAYEPYAMLRPVIRRRWFIPAVAAGGLTGSRVFRGVSPGTRIFRRR